MAWFFFPHVNKVLAKFFPLESTLGYVNSLGVFQNGSFPPPPTKNRRKFLFLFGSLPVNLVEFPMVKLMKVSSKIGSSVVSHSQANAHLSPTNSPKSPFNNSTSLSFQRLLPVILVILWYAGDIGDIVIWWYCDSLHFFNVCLFVSRFQGISLPFDLNSLLGLTKEGIDFQVVQNFFFFFYCNDGSSDFHSVYMWKWQWTNQVNFD